MRIYLFMFFCLSLLLSSCSPKITNSLPVKYTQNWPDDSKPAYFDSVSNTAYELQRDENNIYLHLQTKEMATQMKILRYGLSIWLDPSMQNRQNQGITFPLPAPDSAFGRGFGMGFRGEGRDQKNDKADKNGKASPEQMQQRMLQRVYKRFSDRPKEIIITGLDNNSQKRTLVLGKDACPVQVDTEIGSDNTLNYYAIIPIKSIAAGKNKSLNTFGIEIVSGYFQPDENMQQGNWGGRPQNENSNGQPQMTEEERNARRAFMMKMMEQMSVPVKIRFSVDLKKNG